MKCWFPASILVLWGTTAFLSPFFSLSPNTINLENILAPPASTQWLGFDEVGRPVRDRLITGATTSFLVSVSVVFLGVCIGGILGTASGYARGWIDNLLVRIIDIMLAFPGLLLAIALAAALGPGIGNVIIALGIVGWVGYARLARGQILSLREADHIVAAQAIGASPLRIILRHLLPLIVAPLLVEASFGVASAIIAEAGLSFLGLGVQPPEASWGSMIRDGTRYMLVAPHLVIVPGLTLMMVVLAANLLGDWLRDELDVKNRENRIMSLK